MCAEHPYATSDENGCRGCFIRSKGARQDRLTPKPKGFQRKSHETPLEQVLPLIASGMSVKEVSDAIGLTDSCYKERIRKMKRDVGAKSTAHLVAIAFRKGWIQ